MDNKRTVEGMIEAIVIAQTRYLRHYVGQVVDTNDEKNHGSVKVTIAMLGWISPSVAPWCFPRDKRSMVIPKVGDWVEVYFIAGDKNHPVYLGIANEMKDQVTKSYSDPNKDVIFESGDLSIIYDEILKKFTITDGTKTIVIDSTLGITLGSGDAAIWMPNILAVDPCTGVPHGGPGAGIVLLKGA